VEKYCRAGQATDDNIIRRMRIACRIPKATTTHSAYVILVAFPQQQWLHERASMLHYTYNACPLCPVNWPRVFSVSCICGSFYDAIRNLE